MRRMSAAMRIGTDLAAVFALLVAVTACGTPQDSLAPEGSVTVYSDGTIGCPDHVAGADEDDDPVPVGTVSFEPGPGEVRVVVTLTDAAPDSMYYVEVWSDESCEVGRPLSGYDTPSPEFTTDGNGAGELDFVLTDVAAGTYGLNVDVVNSSGNLDDPRHREMAAATFTEVIVDPA